MDKINNIIQLKNKIRENQVKLNKMVVDRDYNLLDEEVIELSQKLDKLIIECVS